MDQIPRLGKRELICLLSFTCNYVVFVWRGFLFPWVLVMGYVILLWHSLSLPYNYFEHYERLLNVEFEYDPEHLSDEPPLEGSSIPITILMVKRVIYKMKFSKAVGPSGVVAEMIRGAVVTGATMIRDLAIHSRLKGPS